MNPEIKHQFCKALRSGRYKQGRGVLRKTKRSGAEFCASGVLCDLHAKATGGRWVGDAYLNCVDIPSKEVLEWCGVKIGTMLTSDDGLPRTLERLNDNGKTFEELAAMIEQQW